ncbi:hypothetical protein [Candidatus Uabimicrobium sp. HlEnr_7]|uniref:hypothetical protein n=1 Tax=Candidatus Uabimicrobium helgolandensis TaxID=3095367 RepID=UPI003558372E
MKLVFIFTILIVIAKADFDDTLIQHLELGGEYRVEALEIIAGTDHNYDFVAPHLVKIIENDKSHYNILRIFRIIKKPAHDNLKWKRTFLQVIENPFLDEELRTNILGVITESRTNHAEFITLYLLKILEDDLDFNTDSWIQQQIMYSIIKLIINYRQSLECYQKIAKVMYLSLISESCQDVVKSTAARCLATTGIQGEVYRKKFFKLSLQQRKLAPFAIHILSSTDLEKKQKIKYFKLIFSKSEKKILLQTLSSYKNDNDTYFPLIAKLLDRTDNEVRGQAFRTLYLNYIKYSEEKYIDFIKKYQDDYCLKQIIIELFAKNGRIPKELLPFVQKCLYSKSKKTRFFALESLREQTNENGLRIIKNFTKVYSDQQSLTKVVKLLKNMKIASPKKGFVLKIEKVLERVKSKLKK